jgi:valyl-tRNA synthetase
MNKQEKKPFDIKEMEKTILSYWEKEKTFKFDKNSNKPLYSIDTPPPTVSGDMHIGHAFSYAQEDFIARYKRMTKFNVFYPFGTDDNGLPTERLIERLKNIKSKDMSREEFIKTTLKTLKEITPNLIQQWKNLGVSCDYRIYYSTIDKNSRKLSQRSFIDLYHAKQIYEEDFPTIYCPECQTPVAQAELEDQNFNSKFVTLKFKSQGKILPIATTRPELLGACVAVFVHPKDKKFKNLINKTATIPLFNHKVSIFADESVDPKKGSGALMICSYGDKYDVDAIKRLKLAPKVIFNPNGTLNIKPYNGLKIKEARSKILEDLERKKLIISQEPISHTVNTHDKCGTEIEFLPVKQWFIKILDKKTKLINQGKKVKWHPKFMFKRYENWIKGLEWDWSISRKRHFGIPIPIWHCLNCKKHILAKESELPIDPLQTNKSCPICNSQTTPDENVLDTWATSSLTPQIASSLINNIVKIPYSLRPQGHDIIRTWAFYTITKSYLHESQIPWKDIVISGFVTHGGKKMSKSKGTGINPREVMEQYGSDALRYWAASSKLGDDMDYFESDIIAGKKFVTKILNASNFTFMNLIYQNKQPKLVDTDRIFLSQLNNLIESSTKEFNNYNYSKAKLETDAFFFRTFADNYLEIIKDRVYNGTEEEKASASYTLYHSLLTILKLMAPITPFISEHIFLEHFKITEKDKSIHTSDWPKPIPIAKHKHDQKVWLKFIEILYKVRQAKSFAKAPMNTQISSLTLTKTEHKLLGKTLPDLQAVTRANEIKQGPFSISLD